MSSSTKTTTSISRHVDHAEHARRLSDRVHPERENPVHGRPSDRRHLPDLRCVRRAAAGQRAVAGAGDVSLYQRLHRQGRRHRNGRDRAAGHVFTLLWRAIPGLASEQVRRSCWPKRCEAQGARLAGQHGLERRRRPGVGKRISLKNTRAIIDAIRDGWGINPGGRERAVENGDATLLARTPFHDHLYATWPCCRISGSGEDVGLPAGQMGNSEVGHLNLGAGRIVYQDLTRINKAIRDGELAENEVLQEAFVKARGRRIHFIGLVSDGGVHSHQEHLIALGAGREGSGRGRHSRACDHGWARHFADRRCGVISPACAGGPLSNGSEDRDGHRTLFCDVDRDKRSERTRSWHGTRSCSGAGRFRTDTPSAAVKHRLHDGAARR